MPSKPVVTTEIQYYRFSIIKKRAVIKHIYQHPTCGFFYRNNIQQIK